MPFSFVDIMQPCISFNRINTFLWYKERSYFLPSTYDPTDFEIAIKKAFEWGDKTPLGVIYKNNKPILKKGPLAKQDVDTEMLSKIIEKYS